MVCVIFIPTYDFHCRWWQGRQESMTENTQPPTDNLDAEVHEDANELNNIGKILCIPNII